MSLGDIPERFAKLRSMRDKLCKQEHNWQEAFKARDWMVDQLKELKVMVKADSAIAVDVQQKIDDILCVLDPSTIEGKEDA